MKAPAALIAIGYRYFLSVAEAGSVRGAARHLNVAASAISRQLLLLEDQLGIALFDRSGRSLGLSPAGFILRDGLRSAAQGHEATLDHLSALRGLKRGLVRVATVESISVAVLPQVLAAFAARYPGVNVLVTVAGSDAVTALVRANQADLGFTFNPSSLEGLEVVAHRDMAVGAIMAPGHPLSARKSLSLADARAFPLAWPAPGLSLRTLLDRLPAARDIEAAFECNSLRLMASLAREGRCLAFQTVIGIDRELAEGSLVFVALADKRLTFDRLMIVRRRGQQGRLAADAFVALAVERLPPAAKRAKNKNSL